MAIRSDVRVDFSRPALTVVEVQHINDLNKEICGGGLLRTVMVNSHTQIIPFLGPQDQTVTHFGFTEEELTTMALTFGAKGVDRLVPIGDALSFDPIWDGYDLIEDCLRRVMVKREN